MILHANKKFIDASRVVHLLCSGEKYADELIFSVDRTYNGKDLSECLFVIRGVNSEGGLVRETLSSETEGEKILLKWSISPSFTAVSGLLALEIVCYDDESMILKYAISPLQVRESVLESYDGGIDAIEEAIKEMEKILNENREISINLPKIENGNWYLYDHEAKEYIDSEIPVNGSDGKDGESAYDIAVRNGYSGTETEWLDSLKGEKGDIGETGNDGADGLSAYQIWINAGNTGTEADFLASLKGSKGDAGEQGVPGKNGQDGQAGKNGIDGYSAYQIWINAGNTGTEADFLASLKGERGENGTDGDDGSPGLDGLSAYQIWINEGNHGTEADFIASLKGEKGQTGDSGENGFSPIVTINEETEGIRITITDATGTHTAFVKHGKDGGVDLSDYVKKAELQSEVTARETADTALSTRITALENQMQNIAELLSELVEVTE